MTRKQTHKFRLQTPHYIRGFTLIEVLVASAISTVSIGVILQLFASSINRIYRTGEMAHDLLIQQQVMQELSLINPAEKKQGEITLAEKKYHWQVKQIKAPAVIPFTQEELITEKFAGLYQITVNIDDGAKNNTWHLQWDQLGWK